MSNRSMNRRIAALVADAQNLERLALQDEGLGLTAHAVTGFRNAANTLYRVTSHCDKRTRREVLRHVNRLHAKAARMERRAGIFARSLGVSHWLAA